MIGRPSPSIKQAQNKEKKTSRQHEWPLGPSRFPRRHSNRSQMAVLVQEGRILEQFSERLPGLTHKNLEVWELMICSISSQRPTSKRTERDSGSGYEVQRKSAPGRTRARTGTKEIKQGIETIE